MHLGGEEGKAHIADAIEALRHGNLLDEAKLGFKANSDIATHQRENYADFVGPKAVEYVGKMGGANAAAHEAQAVQDFKQGHIIDEITHGLHAFGDIVKHVTGFDKGK